ncbi:MAG: hypothetical protein FJY85_11390, partial [Deltaproteobacteria bacterium]|nr:hypothetical protein [Deltaproteobacteria bacterium]
MCIGLDYENKKKKALRDYERYLGIRADQDDHVDLSRLERFVADLKEDRFSLVVAGEV